MKRILALVLVLLLVFCAAQAESYEDWLWEKTGYMLETLEDILRDETFLRMYASEPSVIARCEGSFSTVPRQATAYYCPEKKVSAILKIIGWGRDEIGNLGDTARQRMIRQMPVLLMNTLVSRQSVEVIVFSNVVQASECFLMPKGFENALVLIDTGEDICAMMTACRSGEGIVTVSISAVPRELIDIDRTVKLAWSLVLRVRELGPHKK